VSSPIERILVVLDATVETHATIASAVRLAAHSKMPLCAVFIEDEDLLNVIELPVARHIVPGAGEATLTAVDVELHWRAAAARARADLVAAAEAQALQCSFEIVRGTAETVLAGMTKRDLIVAGARTRAVAGHFRVPSRWVAMIDAASGPILLAQGKRGTPGGVVVLLRERSAATARLLLAAAQLSEPDGARLTVIAPPDFAATKSFRDWTREQLEPAAVQPHIEAAPAETAALTRRIRELGCHVLAVDATTAEGDRLADLAERFGCDILVVR
jgi:hypothetical protein